MPRHIIATEPLSLLSVPRLIPAGGKRFSTSSECPGWLQQPLSLLFSGFCG
jgi:hypothetical protein